jgi:crossover junction endodeoxyribonuclease RusA
MPLGRRRVPSRVPAVPVRLTSYRQAVIPQNASSTGSDTERAAMLVHLRSAKRATSVSAPQPSPSLSADGLLITLPVPPSVNHQYATVNGRRLLSSVGRHYKDQVSQQLWVALAQSPVRATLMQRLQSRPLALSIRFFFTSALRRDVDGGLKIAQDAVCEGLGLNDNRIVETHLYKHIDKANPRIEVTLTPASPL